MYNKSAQDAKFTGRGEGTFSTKFSLRRGKVSIIHHPGRLKRSETRC